jgi:hypothetical protein
MGKKEAQKMTKTAVVDPREQETKYKREKTKTGMVKIRRKKNVDE